MRRARSGQISCGALVQAYLERIAAYDQAGPAFNAVQNVNPDALRSRPIWTPASKSGELGGPLACIRSGEDGSTPISCRRPMGRRYFKTFVPARTATIVDKLQAAGAIVLAKTNMGEVCPGLFRVRIRRLPQRL